MSDSRAQLTGSAGSARVLLVLAIILLLSGPGAGEDLRGTQLAPARAGLKAINLPAVAELDPSARARITEAERWVSELGGDHPDLGEAYGSLGRVYLAHAFDLAAWECFANAASLEPGRFRWQYYLGLTALRTGDPASASRALEAALKLRPDDLPSRARLGVAYLRSNRLEEAQRLLRKVLERAPDHAYAHSVLGSIAAGEKDWAGAVRHLEAALRLQPQATRLYHPLALAYRQLGDRSRAEALLEKRGPGVVAMADPLLDEANRLASGAQLLLHKGSVAVRQRRFQEALALFEEAIRDDPQNVVANYNVGALMLQLGQTEEALSKFRETLRLDPDYLKARLNLGTVLSQLGRHVEALEHLHKALELDASNASTRQNLANALLRAGSCAAALEHYRWLVERDAASEAGWRGEIRCLVVSGDSAAALDRTRQALTVLPESRRLQEALVRILAAGPGDGVRSGAEAVSLAEKLFSEAPGITTAEALAMAYAEAGRFDDSIRAQRVAIDGARRGRRQDLLPGLEENLRLFERRQPCRSPWP